MTDTAPSSSTVARSVARRAEAHGETRAVLSATLSRAFAPLFEGPHFTDSPCGWVNRGVQVFGSVLSLPGDLVDAGLATASFVPPGNGFPAAGICGALHLGIPHAHPAPPAAPVPGMGVGPTALVGAQAVHIGSVPALRCGDVGFAFGCLGTPTFEILTGSSNVFIGGKRAARALDLTRHCDPFLGQGAPSASRIGGGLDLVTCAIAGASFATHVEAAAHHDREAEAEGASAAEIEIAELSSAAEMRQALVTTAQTLADGTLSSLTSTIGTVPTIGVGDGLVAGAVIGTVLIGGTPTPDIAGAVNTWAHHWARAIASRVGGRLRGAHPEANAGCGQAGEPVGLVEGNVFSDSVDAVLGTFELSRHYDTRDRNRESSLGPGHRHGLDRTLRVWLHRVVYESETGVVIELPPFRGADEVSENGCVVRRLGGRAYDVTYCGETMRFAAADGRREARLDAIRSEAVHVRITRDETDRIERVEVDGQSFAFHHDRRGRLASIDDASGVALVHYAYDASGRLASRTDALGAVERFTYDDDDRITSWVDARSYEFVWRYDDLGRCVHTSGQDRQWSVDLAYERGRTSTTDSAGHTTVTHYDARGIVTRVVRPDGAVLRRHAGLDGRVVRETDAAGRTVEWLYDATGANTGRLDRFGRWLPPAATTTPADESLARALPATLEAQLGLDSTTSFLGPTPIPAELAELAAWALPTPALAPATRIADRRGRTSREVDERGRVTRIERDAAGNVIAKTDRDGGVTRREIARWNLTASETDALGHRRSFTYSDEERVVSFRNATGQLTEYERDSVDRVTAIRRNGVLRESYVFDAGDRLVEKRDLDGNALVTVEPHANALPGALVLASGGRILFDYDRRGRHTRASTAAHEARMSRDALDRVTSDLRNGRGIRRVSFEGGERTTLFGRFESTIETRGDRTTIRDCTGLSHSLVRGEHGRVARTLSNGTREVLAFDEQGRLAGRITHRVTDDGATRTWAVRYVRSAEGDLLACWDSIRGERRFEIDAAHRLVAETNSFGRCAFVLDASNALVEKPGVGRLELDAHGLLRQTDREVFEHDARDRISRRRSAHHDAHYTYDSLDQLVRVDDGEGEAWTATYDGLGRRCRFGRGSSSTELFWDGDRIAAELYASGALRVHVYASGQALTPFAFVDYTSVDASPESGRAYFVFHDASGMPLSIEDQRGRTVWWVDRVEPYGELALHESAEIDYRLRWPGHYSDADLGLHYNRYRDYDPRLGRYLQPDPIGHAGSPGNLYAYAANPLVDVDLNGLVPCSARRATSESEAPDGRPLREEAPAPEAPARRQEPSGDLSLAEKHALAAAPNEGPDGLASPRQRDARHEVVTNFITQRGRRWDTRLGALTGLSDDSIAGQVRGTDLNHPVSFGPPPSLAGGQLVQFQAPGAPRGSYFAYEGATPSELGIGELARVRSHPEQPVVPRVEARYDIVGDPHYMRSTAAAIADDFSVPPSTVPGAPYPAGLIQHTRGGAIQLTIPSGCDQGSSDFRPVAPN